MPDLSVVIVSYNTAGLLRQCLDTLQSAAAVADLATEVIVVDNGSTDDSVAMLRACHPEVALIECATNWGFAGANNLGLARAQAPAVLLLNSDAFVTAAALARCLD